MIGRQVPIEMASTNYRVKAWSPVINELYIEIFSIIYKYRFALVLDAQDAPMHANRQGDTFTTNCS